MSGTESATRGLNSQLYYFRKNFYNGRTVAWTFHKIQGNRAPIENPFNDREAERLLAGKEAGAEVVGLAIYDATSKLRQSTASSATDSGAALLKGSSESSAHLATTASQGGATSSVGSSRNRSAFSTLSSTDCQDFLFAERVEETESFLFSQGVEVKQAFKQMTEPMRDFNSRA